MSNFEDRFRELLRNKELWVAVATAFYRQLPDKWEQMSSVERILSVRGIIVDEEYDIVEDSLTQALNPVFQKYVIDKIGELAPISASDLTSIAIAQLTGLTIERPIHIDAGVKIGESTPSNTADLTSIASAQLAELSSDRAIEFNAGMARFGAFARLEVRVPRRGEKRFALGAWVPGKSNSKRPIHR